MKQTYLIFNEFTKEYVFVDSSNPYSKSNRNELGIIDADELINELKKKINLKRGNSVIYLKDIPKEVSNKLEDFFSKTKVEVRFENKSY